jgi:hypothetical protein
MPTDKFSIKPLLEPLRISPIEAIHKLQMGPEHSSSFCECGPGALTSLFVWFTIIAGSVMLIYAVGWLLYILWTCRKITAPLKTLHSWDMPGKREELRKKGHRLWREWNDSLLIEKNASDSQGRMLRTVDAAHIFNESSLAAGLVHSRLIAATPGLLTAFGVLGAFIGLQLGLKGLNLGAGEIEKSIPDLVSSLSVKFSASIWGILTSIAFNFLEKPLVWIALCRVQAVQYRLDGLFPRHTPEASLFELQNSSAESVSILRGLSVSIGPHMQQALSQVGQFTSIAIKEAMEPAVATFVESVRKTNEDFRTGSSEGLSDAIATSAQRLQESLERVGDRYNQQFIDLSRRLTESFEGLHGPVSMLSDSLQRQDAVLGQAVERLNASAGVTDMLSTAARTLSTAAKQLADLKESWELSAARNETAAAAQDRAAQTNDRVSARFTEAVGHIEKFQEGMETASRVVGSLGAPMHDLHGVLGNLPEIVRDIEGVRKSGDSDRDNNIRKITGDLANTVSKAVEQLAGYSEVAKSLEIAAEKMSRATLSLGEFASQIDSGSASQLRAATAAEDAAKYNAKAASLLEGIPYQLGGMSSSLNSTAQTLRESAQTAAKSFELEAEQQRLFLQELGNALSEYMDGLRGKTQERISEFGERTIHVIQRLETLQNELNNGVEMVQEVGSQLLTKGRK